MDSYLRDINQIYNTHNIYKCILIVDPSCLTNLYFLLQKHDYPVAMKCELGKFIEHQSRMLIIDTNETNDIPNVVDYLNKDEINMIICIDNEIRMRQFENVHHIFL